MRLIRCSVFSLAFLRSRFMSLSSSKVLGRIRPVFFTQYQGAQVSAAATPSEDASIAWGWDSARPFNEVPGPKSFPIVKSLPYVVNTLPIKLGDLFGLFSHLRDTYGPIVRWELPFARPFIFVFDPDMVETAFKYGVGKWPTRDFADYVNFYRKKIRKEWYGGTAGVLPENGQRWHYIRSKVQQPLMNPKISIQYLPQINHVAEDLVDHIRNIRGEDNKVPETFFQELCKWGLESIGSVAFNARLGCLGETASGQSDGRKMMEATKNLFEAMGDMELSMQMWRVFSTKPWRKFVTAMDTATPICLKHVNKALEDTTRPEAGELSVMQLLLLTPGITKHMVLTMCVDMMIGGIESTASSMGFYLYHVAKNPNVQLKIQKEVDEHVGRDNKPVTKDVLNKLRYLKATLKESMRIHPVFAGFPRNIDQDVVLGGYRIPKGTFMYSGCMVMCRDGNYYPDPLQFKPERWIRGHPSHSRASPYTFMPFGHGMRECIARRIAEQELWTLAIKIAQNFWVEYHGREMHVITRLMHIPSEPLNFVFKDRQPRRSKETKINCA